MSKIYVGLNKNVFVKEIEKENKVGTFYVPDSLDVDFTYGEVITCSEGFFDNGSFVPAFVKSGDVVCFPKIAGTKVTLNNQKLIKVDMTDIIAKEVEGEIIDE